jgi:hypothetical protein
VSLDPEARASMERRRASLREAAQGLEEIRRVASSDGALCERLDAIVGGKAIEVLFLGANELTMEAVVVDRELVRRGTS